jgi:hypothetical protein
VQKERVKASKEFHPGRRWKIHPTEYARQHQETDVNPAKRGEEGSSRGRKRLTSRVDPHAELYSTRVERSRPFVRVIPALAPST